MEGAKTIVLKFGGSTFTPDALRPFAERIHSLVQANTRVVIVHGGGKEINAVLDRIGKKSVFIDGLRVTDDETLAVVEMVLSGHVNKSVVRALLSAGVHAVGVAGTDDAMLVAKPLVIEKVDAQGRRFRVDYGHVGEVESTHLGLLETLLASNFVPVVSPLAVNSQGETLNVNADTAAAAIAGALKADAFLLLTDVPGVLVPQDGNQAVAPRLTRADVAALIEKGVIKGGMVPKVGCCLHAIQQGAKGARIVSLDDFLTATIPTGTQIEAE